MSTEIVTTKREEGLASLDPQSLITRAIEMNAGIETLERLTALSKEIRAEQAREEWYLAMAEFQRRCPPIKKTSRAEIRSARGSYGYNYAGLEEVLSTIQPVMGPLKLSVAWSLPQIEPGQVIVSCRVSHALGHHEESGPVAIPIQQGDADRGANAMQRVGIALTYAKRYSLLGIIGMAPEDDTDAGESGSGPRVGVTGNAVYSANPVTAEADATRVITENQVRRLSAIASGQKWTEEQIATLLDQYNYDSRTEITTKDYEAICDRLKRGPVDGLK